MIADRRPIDAIRTFEKLTKLVDGALSSFDPAEILATTNGERAVILSRHARTLDSIQRAVKKYGQEAGLR